MQLSKNFTLEQLIKSDTAVRRRILEQGNPSQETVYNLTNLCENILEPLEFAFTKPLRINSGYRCLRLNIAVGGARYSQHVEGKAVDITCAAATNEMIIKAVLNFGIEFDQMIDEFGSWVHISYNQGKNRKQVLRATHDTNGKTIYSPYQI